MQVSATYLDWPAFATLAGDNFEERYYAYLDPEEGEPTAAPGEVDIEASDDWSDSFIAFSDAAEYLDEHIEEDSPWRPFVDNAFLALIKSPKPRNDLGCPVNFELFASILSPSTVREIMQSSMGQPIPWSEAPGEVEEEIGRWHSIWSKAVERNLGIAYHIG